MYNQCTPTVGGRCCHRNSYQHTYLYKINCMHSMRCTYPENNVNAMLEWLLQHYINLACLLDVHIHMCMLPSQSLLTMHCVNILKPVPFTTICIVYLIHIVQTVNTPGQPVLLQTWYFFLCPLHGSPPYHGPLQNLSWYMVAGPHEALQLPQGDQDIHVPSTGQWCRLHCCFWPA